MKPFVEIHEGAGPALLLVHGFLSSRAQWLPNLAALKDVATPVVLELWGHGRSPSPEDPAAYRVEAYLDIFETIRRSLGVEKWIICGQSFGAGLTLRYALQYPERVSAQIFTNSVSALSPPGTMDRGGDSAARADTLEQGGLAAIEAMPFHPRFAKRFAPDVHAALLEDAAHISPRGIANSLRYTAPNLSVSDDFAKTAVPTMLVNGLWEKSFQTHRAEAARKLPALAIADFEAGHSVNLEAPAAFDAAVRDFLTGNGLSPQS